MFQSYLIFFATRYQLVKIKMTVPMHKFDLNTIPKIILRPFEILIEETANKTGITSLIKQ